MCACCGRESRGSAPSRLCQLLCPPSRQMGTVAHSQPHATITTKSFCFSSNAENRRVVASSPPALGAGGPRFKSGRPDHSFPYFQCTVPVSGAPQRSQRGRNLLLVSKTVGQVLRTKVSGELGFQEESQRLRSRERLLFRYCWAAPFTAKKVDSRIPAMRS